jgi:diamine N-acetyltransferase
MIRGSIKNYASSQRPADRTGSTEVRSSLANVATGHAANPAYKIAFVNDEKRAQPLLIRTAVEADAGALAAFGARTFEETFGAQNRPEDLRAHLERSFGVGQQAEELSNPNMHTLLAYFATGLVGFAQVKRQAPPPEIIIDRPIELHRFYVDRPAHGTGVAQQLMQAVHAAARAFDGRTLWLGVWEHNPRAIAFYKKVGFVDRGSQDFYVGADRQTDRVLVAPVQIRGSDAPAGG